MAKKQESTFDPDKFLDCYDERTPSANTDAPAKPKPQPPAEPLSKPPAPSSVKNTDRELDYLEKFIQQKEYSQVMRKGKQVAVCEDFKLKIQKLLLFFSDGGGTITGYVNNVLEQHFREYDYVIQKMFNNTKI